MTRTYTFLKRYRILHFLFWLVWYLNLSEQLRLHRGPGTPLSATYLLPVFSILSSMLLVYGVNYVLIPRLFDRRKHILFLLSVAGMLLLFSFVSVFSVKLVSYLAYHTAFSWRISIAFISRLYDNILLTAGFTTIAIISRSIESELRQRKLEKEKIEAELNFLKAQINPHFLFNTINSIYVLMDENPREARSTLLRFCDILRYQLYESSAAKVPLSSEIALINNYIELEKLRRGDSVDVSFVNRSDDDGLMIAPFLMITYVENAFKHISVSPSVRKTVIIELTNANGVLLFSCSNSFDPLVATSDKGIGTNNAARRLELIYPGKHRLQIKKELSTYTVNLEITTE